MTTAMHGTAGQVSQYRDRLKTEAAGPSGRTTPLIELADDADAQRLLRELGRI